MGPVEEERWVRVDREPVVDPLVDPAAAPPRPGQTVREEHYASPAGVGGYDPRIERVIWFVVAVVCSMIAIRFFMKLLGASLQSDFVRFVYGVSGPFVGPFHGIFPATGSGNNVLEPESLIAMAIYLLIGWGIVALVRIIGTPRNHPVV